METIETMLSPANTNPVQILIDARFIAANQSAGDAEIERCSQGRKPSFMDQGVTVDSVVVLGEAAGHSVNAVGYIQKKSAARTAMLDAAQKTNWFQVAEKTPGWEVLSAPRVSTPVGRPAKITIVRSEMIDDSFGPTLDVLPEVHDGIIDLDVTATIAEKAAPPTDKPGIRKSEIKGKFSVENRGAVILSGPEFRAPDGRGYYIVISARQIDSAGNPVDP